MRRVFAGSALAMAVTLGMVASAQSTGQPPAQPQPPATAQAAAPQEQKAPAEQITLVGCVQREEDYRKANNLGKGGAAGTGVGAGDEFVLVNASKVAAGATGATGTTGTTPPSAAPAEAAYELSGDKEDDVKAFVGKRVEIMGTLKAAEKGPMGPTGGATAGKPPAGVDIASADLKLREIDIISVKETTGTCPTSIK